MNAIDRIKALRFDPPAYDPDGFWFGEPPMQMTWSSEPPADDERSWVWEIDVDAFWPERPTE